VPSSRCNDFVAAHGVAVSKVTGKFGSTDVRFGSKADVGSASVDVRFTPKSGHRSAR
jgi:hypothetical protein